MSKRLRDEKGLTLVELLAVIAIAALIIIFASSLIVQAMKNQERITAEAQLRDEADLLMSSLMKEIFTLKESEIEKVACGTLTNSTPTLVSCLTNSDTLTVTQAAQVASAKSEMEACAQAVNCSPYAFVYLNDNSKIGFQDDTVFLRDEQYQIKAKGIRLAPYYTMELRQASQQKMSIIVAFQLINEKKNMTQSFRNEIIVVNDKTP